MGLINLELDLLTATEDGGSYRKMFAAVTTGEGEDAVTAYHPIGQRKYDTVTDGDVANDAVVKGVQVDSETVVIITDDELTAMATERGACEVLAIEPRERVLSHPWLVPSGKVYWPRPTMTTVGRDKRPNVGAEQLWAALRRYLLDTGRVIVLRVVLRDGGPRRTCYLEVLPEGHGVEEGTARLVMVRTMDEVRPAISQRPPLEAGAREVTLLAQLFEHLDVQPLERLEVRDEMRALIDGVVEAKLAGKDVGMATQAPSTSGPTDLMSQLEAAIKASGGDDRPAAKRKKGK